MSAIRNFVVTSVVTKMSFVSLYRCMQFKYEEFLSNPQQTCSSVPVPHFNRQTISPEKLERVTR